MGTLQGINTSHLGKRKIIFKMPFLGNMLVPWRVNWLMVFSPSQMKKICDRPKWEFSKFWGENSQHKLKFHHPGTSRLIVTSIPPGKDRWRSLPPMYCFVTTKTNRHLLGVAPFTTVYLKLTYTVYLYQLQRRIPISVATTSAIKNGCHLLSFTKSVDRLL